MNCAYCGECDSAGDLLTSHEMHHRHMSTSVLEVSRNVGIRQSSFGQVIP